MSFGVPTGDETLPGMPVGERGRERWGVEIEALALVVPEHGGAPRPTKVRVTLIDHQTGKRLGASVMPFEWLTDVAAGGMCLANIRPGVWE